MSTRFASAGFEVQSEVELMYGEVDGEPMLVEVRQVDPSTGDGLILAELAYAEYPMPGALNKPAQYPDAPPWPTTTITTVRSNLEPSHTSTFRGLLDTSGDGLVDLALGAGAGGWLLWGDDDQATWEGADERAFDLPGETPCAWQDLATGACEYNGASLDRSYTVRCNDDQSTTYAVRHLVDIDHDGFQDVVQTDATCPRPT